MTSNNMTQVIELSHFIWSELELQELKWPVYNSCNTGAYEIMYACYDIATQLRPVAANNDTPWLDTLYITCSNIACSMHTFMRREGRVPTWADLGDYH